MSNTHQVAQTMNIIEIVSGEGTGEGTVETFCGRRTARAIRARLTREQCGGDRWAFCRIGDVRVAYADIAVSL